MRMAYSAKNELMIKQIAAIAKTHVFSVLAFSIFGLMFAMRPVTWLPTLILLGCAIAAVVNQGFRCKLMTVASGKDLRWVVVAFAGWFAACLMVGLWHVGLSKHAFPENPFRIFLALGVLALTVHKASKKWFITGLLVASVCVALNVLYGYVAYDDYFPRISGTTNHPIHFGNFSALLAVLLISVALLGRGYKAALRALCLSGALLALGATVASQSRSSFGALLCLAPLCVVAKTDLFHRWTLRVTYVLTIAVTLLVATTPSLQEKLRLTTVVSDIEMIEANNYQGSVGSRLAMWKAAWSMFEAHPIVGIGPHKFQAEFIKKMQAGEVPRADAEHNQPHNDILNAASTGGVLKLMAYLFLMVGPFAFFYKKYKSNQLNLDARMLPIMGIQVVFVFFITGLTNSNFDLQIYSTAYAVVVCVLARLIEFEQALLDSAALGSR